MWDDLPELLGIVSALGWDDFDLLGHSRGAIICTLLAAAFPERIRHLVLLDAVSPEAVEPERFPAQLRSALQDKQRLLGREGRVFPDREQAVAVRAGNGGLPDYAARLISERNLRRVAGGYAWTTDPRLQGASPVKMGEAQIAAALSALDMPVLLTLAEGGDRSARAWMEQHARRHIEGVQVAWATGGHHFHLEAAVGTLAPSIIDFLHGEPRESAT
ncbi:MAG: alpha/beta fold hydrolase [Halioglobus sp.]|nr:alpha/beta fold hydrolase [Halioglobus sp.]